jgi:hypothetical protein
MFKGKEALVRELLDLMGTRDKYRTAAGQMVQRYNAYGVGDIIREAVDNEMDYLFEGTVEIYTEVFDHKTLKKLLKFYKSNIGKEFIKASPVIDQALAALSTRWQAKVIEEAEKLVLKEKVERGINPTDYIPPLRPYK